TESAEYESVDINAVINASLRLAAFDKSFQKLELKTELAADIPEINVNPDQLQQVFLNLLLNARDAVEGDGSVTIRSYFDGENAVTEIIDSGSGIDEAVLKNVFDPFFTTKPAGSGTGLGLAVCYGIITAHGGNIDAAKHIGGGSAFTIKLPA